MLGGLLALLAAATFALNNTSLRRGVLSGTAWQAMAITVPLGLPLFLIVAFASGHLALLATFTPQAALALAAAGVVHFVWGRYFNYRATMAIGANLVAPVQQFSLLITLTLAILVLGETLTPLRIAGIALVVIGPAFTWRDSAKPIVTRAGMTPFQPRYAEGYVFALLSATGYGSSPILVRMAIEGKGFGGALAGGVISYGAATAVILLFLLVPGQFAHARSVNPGAARWFTLSGVLVCMSQMFNYMAMSIAPVSVVTPIQRTSIVFRIYFARLLTPHHEVFGGGVILGTFVSLVGAVLLSLSTEVAQSVLPESLGVLLRWHWP